MGSINRQVSRFEITPVFTHPDAEVDIVLVHGLNGDPARTWTSKTSDGVFWPADLLPETLKSGGGKPANILVYGYNADVFTSKLSTKHNTATSSDFILTHAQSLVNTLAIYRKSERTSRNAIVWVAHSLGGILVKRALLYSNDVTADKHDYLRSIYVSTYGIIFLGTPHQGSQVANWGRMLQAMAEVAVPKKLYHTEGVLLKTLKKDSETLQQINNHFLDIYQRFKIQMVREAQMTDLKGTRGFVVDAASAGPDLPEVTYYSIEATHSGMCKFASKDAPGYRNVSESIREWVMEAPQTVQVRWEVEVDDRRKRALRDAAERVGRYVEYTDQSGQSVQGALVRPMPRETRPNTVEFQPPKLLPPATGDGSKSDSDDSPHVQNPNESFSSRVESEHGPGFPFIVPDGFRPNPLFKGRGDELKNLHRALMDPKRRQEGTSSALIHGMPGSGKTYLAREYVFRHIQDFPGGIFWVRAKSLKEAEDAFWRIARHEAFRSYHSAEDIRNLRNQSKMVEIVRKWLAKRENWLMIVDGIHFTDEGMHQFIPFTQNTSLIYTSTERSIADHRFNNPLVIELPRLRAREAQELLLQEIGKKKPYTQDDLARALELVQLMEYLPLMINVAAHQMTATGEPLSKYLRSYKKSPRIGGIRGFAAVLRQLRDRGETEALNLMNILSFYSHEVPFEMLTFGLRALDSTTPVKARDVLLGQSSLNTTFRVLISFGLLERNVEDATTSSQSSTSRSAEQASDGFDIVKLHSVIQAFFIDTLIEKKEKDVPFWLERAIAVYCRSYDEADRRIKADPKTGLPDDYRIYRTHGENLTTHLIRFEKKYGARLAHARQELEGRYGRINEEIEDLTETLLKGEVASVSIFRSPSISDSDMTTPVSRPSIEGVGYFADEDDQMPVMSPINYDRAHENVPQFHRPYPEDDFYGEIRMPLMPHEATDDDRTVSPGPSHSGVLESIKRPIGSNDSDSDSEWTTVQHRTVRKNSLRRYRDHAGAWRQTSGQVVDPRVSTNRPFTSISRYTARGIVLPAAHEPQLTTGAHERHQSDAKSEAEETLAKISTKSPPRPKSRTTSDSSPIRPSLAALGCNSYARVATELAGRESATPTFSQILENASNLATAALKKVGAMGADSVSSPAPTGLGVSLEFGQQDRGHADVEEGHFVDNLDIQNHYIQASQSANSSPAQRGSAWHAPGLPIERHTTSALHREPASSSSIAQSPPGLGRDSTRSSGMLEGERYQRMAHSVPAIPQTQIHPPASTSNTGRSTPLNAAAGATPWTTGQPPYPVSVYGYSSQPMSRGPSHQSGGSDPGSSSASRGEGTLARRGRSGVPPRFTKRASSIVESEPSPRLNPLEAPLTSYGAYQDRVGGGRRPRAGSEASTQPPISIFAGFNQSGFPAGSPDSGGRPSGGNHRSRDASAVSGGSGSGSGSRSITRVENRSVSRGRGAQDMSRSVSGGGIAVEGRIIEFREHPIDIDEANKSPQPINEESNMQPREDMYDYGTRGDTRRDDGHVVLGVDSGVGLGILRD